MLTDRDAPEVMGATAYTEGGDKLGKVGQVFLDDQTNRPEFITVNTGMFGTKETFIPVQRATFNGGRVTVPFDKDKVKNAPSVDVDGGHLDEAEEQRLYEYYEMDYHSGHDTVTGDAAGGTGTQGTGREAGQGTAQGWSDTGTAASGTGTAAAGAGAGHDTSGPDTDEAMTRSEERLDVDKTTQQTGRARLRKFVTTETETHTVPVRKEKAVLEREPITDANVDEATSGPDISDEEHEVTLSEERVVVNKVTEPKERVRLGTETVTDEQTVSDDVRKEHIEAEGDVDDASRR